MSTLTFNVGDVIEFCGRRTGKLIEATVTEVTGNVSSPVKINYTDPSGAKYSNVPLDASTITRVISSTGTTLVHAYKVGDRVQYNIALDGLIYKITALSNKDHFYSHETIGTSYTHEHDKLDPDKTHLVNETHKYKVGDVFCWPQSSNPHRGYEITKVCVVDNHYNFTCSFNGMKYREHYVAPENTNLVSSSTEQVEQEVQVEKCNWSVRRLIDVEPVYHKIYTRLSSSRLAKQEEQANKQLVIKRAQAYGVLSVPFCLIADKPISIIAVTIESTDKKDQWETQAFLFCEHCARA